MRVMMGFILGIAMHATMSCLVQDWYGLELYVELCRKHWVTLHWAVWIPIVALIGCKLGIEVVKDVLRRVKAVPSFPDYRMTPRHWR